MITAGCHSYSALLFFSSSSLLLLSFTHIYHMPPQCLSKNLLDRLILLYHIVLLSSIVRDWNFQINRLGYSSYQRTTKYVMQSLSIFKSQKKYNLLMTKNILHIKLSFIDDPALSWNEFMYLNKRCHLWNDRTMKVLSLKKKQPRLCLK